GVICRTRHLISTLKTRSVWAGTLDLAEARDRLGRTKLVIVGSVFTDKILVTRNSFTIANLLGEVGEVSVEVGFKLGQPIPIVGNRTGIDHDDVQIGARIFNSDGILPSSDFQVRQ